MSHHQSQGTYKHDRPAWRWQGHGGYKYTHDDDAARYVAQCRQREIDRLHQREARKVTIVPTITDSARLIAAASKIGKAA